MLELEVETINISFASILGSYVFKQIGDEVEESKHALRRREVRV